MSTRNEVQRGVGVERRCPSTKHFFKIYELNMAWFGAFLRTWLVIFCLSYRSEGLLKVTRSDVYTVYVVISQKRCKIETLLLPSINRQLCMTY